MTSAVSQEIGGDDDIAKVFEEFLTISFMDIRP